MKRFMLLVCSLLLVVAAASTVLAAKAQKKGVFQAKAGDVIYVCTCGEGCDCGTLSTKEGKCGCGKDLVKSTVTKVEAGKVFYEVDGKEQSAPLKGKYTCGCKGCNCGTVSQKTGKCGCNEDMVKVKK